MDDSAKRRHILSSINPERPHGERRSRSPQRQPQPASASEASPAPDAGGEDVHVDGDHDDATKPRSSRLKLKGHRSRRDRSDDDRSHDSSSRRSHRRHHHHRHSRRRQRSPTPPNPFEEPNLDPEAAFRESLFDAMADDEGAAYWEGVYGQPVHVYANEKAGPNGELEQMTDEEYAAYVRQKMWEKTHAGLLEERERRKEEAERRRKKERQDRKLREDVEISLQRGEERRRRRMWAARWDEYTKAWSSSSSDHHQGGVVDALFAWPVETGRREDVNEVNVRNFFVRGLDLENLGEREFVAKLRDERVRWHPDKVQQRLGGQVDGEVMRDVTAIFQIIDGLFNDTRAKADI